MSENATGDLRDLLVFIFVNIPLKLSHFCESKSFFTTFCVVLVNHLQFLKRIRMDQKYSEYEINSEIKAESKQWDHEVSTA